MPFHRNPKTTNRSPTRVSLAAVLCLFFVASACDSDSDSDSDGTPPTVVSTIPDAVAIGVALGGNLAVTFDEAINPATITSATLTLNKGTTAVPGTVSYTGVTASFSATRPLDPNTAYAAIVTTGVKDLAGNALAADHRWTFTTGVNTDTEAPTVRTTVPADGALEVGVNRNISVDFSEAMSPTTLTAATFTVTGPGATAIAGTVTYAGTRATFAPTTDLAIDTVFDALIATDAKDLAGNALASAYTWSFTTSATVVRGPSPVLLGMAANYAILAKSGIDTVPSSVVTGDIGVSPIDSTAITGFSLAVDASNQYATSTQVIGQVHAPDYTSPTPEDLTTAVLDMQTAYTDAAGRPTPDFVDLGAGEIGGLTLAPGLYKWGTGVSIATDVTLDGGANDVWIFQISGDITQAGGALVTLTGGALAKNIFWQTFGQLDVRAGAHFEGIVLCQTAIVLATGASVNGRLLAQTAVTLDQNAVTEPAP